MDKKRQRSRQQSALGIGHGARGTVQPIACHAVVVNDEVGQISLATWTRRTTLSTEVGFPKHVQDLISFRYIIIPDLLAVSYCVHRPRHGTSVSGNKRFLVVIDQSKYLFNKKGNRLILLIKKLYEVSFSYFLL